MSKKLILLLLILLPAGVLARPCLKMHHIFLIHGIGGSAKTFGSLADYLNALDSCHLARAFEYETGSGLEPKEFSNHFNTFVEGQLREGMIDRSDKISLIMHSQGGIVGAFWIKQLLLSQSDLLFQIDSFITLSTPFWGAEMANLGKKLFFTLPQHVENPLSPFGREELNQMSFGSDNIRTILSSFRSLFDHNLIRPLAIGGFHEKGSEIIGEGDVVVPIYSSRPDHYQLERITSLKREFDSIESDEFRKLTKIPFVSVPAAHIRMDLPGIADLPKSCVHSKKCLHPAVEHIVRHLRGQTIEVKHLDLKTFRISLFVNNLDQFNLSQKDLEINIVHRGPSSIKPSLTYSAPAKRQDGASFTIEGKLKASQTNVITLNLSIKNYIQRNITVPIEGGYSSLVSLELAP